MKKRLLVFGIGGPVRLGVDVVLGVFYFDLGRFGEALQVELHVMGVALVLFSVGFGFEDAEASGSRAHVDGLLNCANFGCSSYLVD